MPSTRELIRPLESPLGEFHAQGQLGIDSGIDLGTYGLAVFRQIQSERITNIRPFFV